MQFLTSRVNWALLRCKEIVSSTDKCYFLVSVLLLKYCKTKTFHKPT